MDRKKFIETVWKKYPRCSQEKESFVYGRVWEIKSEIVKVMSNKLIFEYVGLNIEKTDDQFGQSIPAHLLKTGDVVAYDRKEKVFYLLSPDFTDCNIKLERPEEAWNTFLREIEIFFLEEEFFQARTPFLVTSPGVDHHIDFLEVKGSQTGRAWGLPTSPEIHLKKLLCSGFEKVFEVKSCFRDDLEGDHHKVEFTMLEWYRSFVNLEYLVQDLEFLIARLYKNKVEIKRSRLKDRFLEFTGAELCPQTTIEELQAMATELDIEFQKDDTWNDLFFRIYMEKIEPQLGQDQPEVIFDFPSQQASLAQINSEGWAQRFELYWKGVELANAYVEVNDPQENKIRFEQEQSLRQNAGKGVSPLDKDYFAKLEQGMPPSCGIALGLDRLFMILQGNSSI